MSDNEVRVSPERAVRAADRPAKVTSQDAALESFLTTQRTKQILKYVPGKTVLDFGCGAHYKTLKAVRPLAKQCFGLDVRFQNQPPVEPEEGIWLVGEFDVLRELCGRLQTRVNCVTSLACFEHLEPPELLEVLEELHHLTAADALIVGTVPTPRARPVLEFLSYKLGLIDPSQIRDHKVYYDREALQRVVRDSRWTLSRYRTFQLGCNSFFEMRKA